MNRPWSAPAFAFMLAIPFAVVWYIIASAIGVVVGLSIGVNGSCSPLLGLAAIALMIGVHEFITLAPANITRILLHRHNTLRTTIAVHVPGLILLLTLIPGLFSLACL